MKSKKAMEWYFIAAMIVLVVSAVLIAMYLSGVFNKLGVVGSKSLFGWLSFGK